MERGFAGLRKLTQISPFTNAFFFFYSNVSHIKTLTKRKQIIITWKLITRKRAKRLKHLLLHHLRLPTAARTSTPKFWDIWVKEKKTFINGLICVTFLEPAKPFSHSYNCGCKTSWITIMLVWPPTNQTSLATNQVVISCEKLLQKVESISTFCNKICKSVKNL